MKTTPRLLLALVLAAAPAACGDSTVVLPGADPGTVTPYDATTSDPGTPPGEDTPWTEPDYGPVKDVPIVPYDPGTAVCTGNNDGRIDPEELPVALGAVATFFVNPTGTKVAIDPEGVPDGDRRVWDFRGLPATEKSPLFVNAPEGYWFAWRFPGATFVSPISLQDPSIVGVYHASADGVQLLGIASTAENPPSGKTLLVYDEPVLVTALPLYVGRAWETTSSFSGATLMGLPNAGSERYAIVVDALGTVVLPDLTASNVLRLRIQVTQTFSIGPAEPVTTVQYLWVRECLGEVARAVGIPGETGPFEYAKEWRRLGF